MNILLNALPQREREILIAISHSEEQVSESVACILQAREFEERMKRYPNIVQALAQVEAMAVPTSTNVSVFSTYASIIEEEEGGQPLSVAAAKQLETGYLLSGVLRSMAQAQ